MVLAAMAVTSSTAVQRRFYALVGTNHAQGKARQGF